MSKSRKGSSNRAKASSSSVRQVQLEKDTHSLEQRTLYLSNHAGFRWTKKKGVSTALDRRQTSPMPGTSSALTPLTSVFGRSSRPKRTLFRAGAEGKGAAEVEQAVAAQLPDSYRRDKPTTPAPVIDIAPRLATIIPIGKGA